VEPETARGGSGVQDPNPEDPDGDHGEVIQAAHEEQTVSSEEVTNEQRPELTFPAKLTEREHEDIAAQVYPLPTEVAQQMLDVIQARIQSGPPIRTNPAAMLRGILRKYHADTSSFDPSSGFHVAEARRRRVESEARLWVEAERRAREREALPAAPGAAEVRSRSIASMLRSLRGH
jgi:hypothetical protein